MAKLDLTKDRVLYVKSRWFLYQYSGLHVFPYTQNAMETTFPLLFKNRSDYFILQVNAQIVCIDLRTVYWNSSHYIEYNTVIVVQKFNKKEIKTHVELSCVIHIHNTKHILCWKQEKLYFF